MNEQEKAQAHQEALGASSRAGRSAERARLWAGLNRYLATEARHEQKLADEEKKESTEER
jgi:hypothetical protein